MTREWLLQDPRNMLYFELFLAELQARKGGKRKTYDTHMFEQNLYENLTRLRDGIWDYSYKPSRGTAHIIFKPVQREIFAAPYVDRIAHHFVVNALVDWWEKRLSPASCSCRVGKGTSYGIEMLRRNIQAASDNYRIPVFVVKMDISGYFMHIERSTLYERVVWGLNRQFAGNYGRRYKMLKYMIKEIIHDDPVKGVKIQGSYEDWRNLPNDKSLFVQPPGRGLVIGNLTSQFFSNVYLDSLDRFIEFDLGYQFYGRYVDDFYVVVREEEISQTKRDVREIATFLQGIGLTLNFKKTRILPAWQGIPFLGMVVKNDAVIPGKRMVNNFHESSYELVSGTGSVESVISYLGMLHNYNSKKVVEDVFKRVGWEYRY